MRLSPNPEIFAEFFSAFPESTYNLEYFKKKMSLRCDLFLNLQTAKKKEKNAPCQNTYRQSTC